MHAPSSAVLPAAFSCRRGLALAGALVCLAGIGLSSGSAHADDAACKAIEEAMIANTKTPYHSFTTITFDYTAVVAEAQRKLKLPSSQASETIFTGEAVYVRLLPRKWQALPTSPAQFRESVSASIAGFTNCKRLADATVDGAAVPVYIGDTTQQNRPVETKIWISAQGIPIKSETDIDVAGPPGVETIRQHLSTRYEYGDIRAPSLTQ
jgi:hypothetical protein